MGTVVTDRRIHSALYLQKKPVKKEPNTPSPYLSQVPSFSMSILVRVDTLFTNNDVCVYLRHFLRPNAILQYPQKHGGCHAPPRLPITVETGQPPPDRNYRL